MEEPDWEGDLVRIKTENTLIIVDMSLDRETLLEGLAREIICRIQVLRKEPDLPVSLVAEKLLLYTEGDLREVVEKYRELIMNEVRVKRLELQEKPLSTGKEWDIEGYKIKIHLIP